jgi:diguanylate cyclase (GGDEF)-like protein
LSLQRRLMLFFILIVILPLVAAGLVVRGVVVGEISERAELGLQPALNSAITRYNDRSDLISSLAMSVVEGSTELSRALTRGDDAAVEAYLRRQVAGIGALDFLIAINPLTGEVIAGARGAGEFAPGFKRPSLRRILSDTSLTQPGFTRTAPIEITADGRERARVVGGFWLDNQLLAGTDRSGVDNFLVAGERVIASTRSLQEPAAIGRVSQGVSEIRVAGEGGVEGKTAGSSIDGLRLLAVADHAPARSAANEVLESMVLLLVAALLAILLLSWFIARLITRPLAELNEAASAIAKGHFDHHIPVRSSDEVGRLASAFNDMATQLETTISDLASSRDSMQRAVERVGETLRSTHDMDQILESILNTSVDAVNAEAGVLWLLAQKRDELVPQHSLGVRESDLGRIQVGRGVAGLVAERGVTVWLPGHEGGPRPGRSEPQFPVTIALPLYSSERVIGVLTVCRSDGGRPFTHRDLDTVEFLGEQGGVAIENVTLHHEAQRLSLTDGLTGTWNRRYLQMQFRHQIASSARFDRPFSVLMLDLDHFKDVNDTFGHRRGDAILVEFAARVGSDLREIDTFARYGGEEFVCLLAETDLAGALVTAEKIRSAIELEPFSEDAPAPISLTVSIGVASYPQHGNRYNSLIEASDRALYRAKQEGRNTVRVAGSPEPGLHLAQ